MRSRHLSLMFLVPVAVLAVACSSSHSASGSPTSTVPGPHGLITLPVPTVKGGKRSGNPVPASTSSDLSSRAPIPTAKPMPTQWFTSTVFGTVTDAATHQPILGATVIVGSSPALTASTDSTGHYRLAFPRDVFAPVQVKKTGYTGQLAMGMLGGKQTHRVDFKLNKIVPGKPVAPAPPSIFGRPPNKP